MSDEAANVVRALAFLTLLTVGSYALLKAMPALELYAAGARERAVEEWRRAREWHRATSEVLFEAYYATREAADNGSN